jgi:hypothetical protein
MIKKKDEKQHKQRASSCPLCSAFSICWNNNKKSNLLFRKGWLMLAGSWLEESPERMTTYIPIQWVCSKCFPKYGIYYPRCRPMQLSYTIQALHFVHCREWYNSNRYDFAYNRRCNLGTLKELLSCYKSQKTVSSLRAKKGSVCFEVAYIPLPLVILNYRVRNLQDTSTKLTLPMPSSKNDCW